MCVVWLSPLKPDNDSVIIAHCAYLSRWERRSRAQHHRAAWALTPHREARVDCVRLKQMAEMKGFYLIRYIERINIFFLLLHLH